MSIHNVSLLFFILFSPVFCDEDYVQSLGCCTFKGPDFEDIEYTIVNFMNKNIETEYNSTRGNWTGFTAFAIKIAADVNKNPFDAAQRAFEKKLLCTDHIPGIHYLAVNLTTIPTIRLKSVKPPSGRHPAMLVCSAYDFYPKQIRMTWLRNGEEVTAGVSYSKVMGDGEFSYQSHSYLEYTPTSGEEITCMTEHFSLSEPVLVVWDPSLPVAEQIQIAVGLCGLLLGLVVVSSGFIYHKKKSAAYFTVCRGRELVPVEHLPTAAAT